MVTLGIDLGTTFSGAVSVVRGNLKPIAHSGGRLFLESIIKFHDNEFVVGELDAFLDEGYQEGIVFDSKRMLGRQLNDPEVQKYVNQWPFTLSEDRNGGIRITTTENGRTHSYTPVEISGFILRRLREVAEEQLDQQVIRTVVTVPARFNQLQRQATADACECAQLPNVSLLNEPTAAAINYDQNNQVPVNSKLLVYDLGGGTFDLSIVKKLPDKLENQYIDGDPSLGGRDFDCNLVDRIRQKYRARHNRELPDDRRTRYLLLNACVQAKLRLSQEMTTNVIVDVLTDGCPPVNEKITRAEFERCNATLFKKTISIVDRLLTRAGITKEEIDKVLLVGGSIRIPRIQELVGEYFGANKLVYTEHPDQAIVQGAARQAARLACESGQCASDHAIQEVCSLNLGVEDSTGTMVVVIPQATPVPTTRVHFATTAVDGQHTMDVNVYEGNQSKAKENVFIGNFTLSGLPPMPAGKLLVRIEFQYDAYSMLKVIATCRENGQTKSISVSLPEAMRRAAERGELRQRVNDLRSGGNNVPQRDQDPIIGKLRRKLDQLERDLGNGSNEHLRRKIAEIREWIRVNHYFTTADAQYKLDELQAAADEAFPMPES